MENKKYWKGIEELTNDTEFVKLAEKEFPEYLPTESEDGNGHNRRDFLKLLGFSVAAASVAACETPVKKAIPYLNKPTDIDPSIPNFYASTYFEDGDYCSILVKTREGRPIKIEGNKLSKVSLGGTSARAQSSVLDLYDQTRYKKFQAAGKDAKAEDVDKQIISKLASANNIRIVSSTVISPSTKQAVADFMAKYPSAKHVTYDVNSAYGILQANKKSFGKAMVPAYDFGKADVIVSFSADFLGTWISPTEFARQYSKNRKLNKDKKEMSQHFQFEANLSLTGANADYRTPLTPSQEAKAVAALYEKMTGSGKFGDAKIDAALDKAAKALKAAKGKALVVSGSNDPDVQLVVNAINDAVGAYGSTIDTNVAINLYQGDDKAMNAFVKDLKGGKVDAVIFYGTNPVYDHPSGKDIADNLKKAKLSVSFADRPDETSELCNFVCPDHHYLEAWNDAEPKTGHLSLAQPAITPLFETRAAQESLLTWAGKKVNFYDYVRAYWKKNIFPTQSEQSDFESFWNVVLHDGVFVGKTKATPTPAAAEEGDEETTEEVATTTGGNFSVSSAISNIKSNYKGGGIELVLYPKIAIGTGKRANNPWLQEMPDPISKATWGNYVAVSQAMAKDKKWKQGDKVKVSVSGKSAVELPVLVQPGQANNTIAIAIGHGRSVSGKVGKDVGANVYPWASTKNGFVNYRLTGVTIGEAEGNEEIAQTQTHHTIMARDIIQEATLKDYQKDPAAGRSQIMIHTPTGLKKPTDITLWKGHDYPNHSWGMVIDLNSCIGCGACTIACQAENNVPVVGKKEVLMRREMHWIRIDRYYSSTAEPTDLQGLEEASENPEVTFMPMMCQHCNNAPCETVCPVLATTHSTEGLNQMTYNRCIGTRYCANNCPYKVRRFNWFHYAEDKRFTEQNYSQTNDLGKMVLNPDVTVRSRGVMEKCSMCVQRIQSGKLEAKKEKRRPKDGEIQVACAQACPTEAIIFGDMNDGESLISQTLGIKKEIEKGERGAKDKTVYSITEPRAYHVLDEINVKPQVSYLTKIRNKDKLQTKPKAGHGGGSTSKAKEESHG